ncbi:MAG TPA: radical SAM protein [Arenibaculum sp.]|nr:radical SAM protein [Arenibaculum sp.]
MTDILAFESAVGWHALAVDGSRIYDIDRDTFETLLGGEIPSDMAGLVDGTRGRYVDDRPLSPPAIRALSLNVAQGCNLACTYCYADEGRFGGRSRLMGQDVALAAVDRLLAGTRPGEDAVLGFMGGEPLLNRGLIQAVVPEADRRARRRGVRLRFSLTTNATLATPADAELFAAYPFTVTVSLDGNREVNDRQRPGRDRHGSFERAMAGLATLASRKPRHLSIRATVTPRMRGLPEILDFLLGLDVDEAGFAPVLVAPNPADGFQTDDFARFLDEMIACGEVAKARLLAGRRYPFSNFETALHEIARGTHRPYPCGAGAGYASVSAEGGLFACHRAIDDERFAIGTVEEGPDDARRARFLEERHLSRQTPCTTCWARQLCGGGCHQEVLRRGRVGCDYVRGWLHWCLSAFAEISEQRPDYFRDPNAYFDAAT